MPLSRRDLLAWSAASGVVLGLPRILEARPEDEASARSAPPKKTLVLIHLNGGNDGVNTVVPYTQKRYRSLRPGIALNNGQLRKLEDGLALHPSLQGLEALYKAGKLAIVNGCGYPNPNYSHFRATEIWHTAQPENTPVDGWMGRALEHHDSDRPLRAVALLKQQPLSLVTSVPGVVTMTDFGRFRVPSGLDHVTKLYDAYQGLDGSRKVVGAAGTSAIDVAGRISRLRPAQAPLYGPLGESLKRALALLQADLGLECIQLAQGGYDTHANQTASHNRLLGQLGNNLQRFQAALEKAGLADRVVTVVYSEFGRRARENLSGGTDHGSAGPVFVMGKGVNAGMHGAYPSLDDLDRDNLKFTTDFRRVYASLIQHAFGIDPKPVLGDYAPLELFA